MVDKYTVRSVTTPAFPSGLQYHDSYSDWTILELFPHRQPGTVIMGGISVQGYQILIPPATNERLKPAKGDVIELSMSIARVGAQTMRPLEPNAHLFNAKNKTITYPPELVELLKDGEYTTQVNPGDGKRLEVIVWKKVKTLYVDKIMLDDIKQVEHAEIEDREGKWVERK